MNSAGPWSGYLGSSSAAREHHHLQSPSLPLQMPPTSMNICKMRTSVRLSSKYIRIHMLLSLLMAGTHKLYFQFVWHRMPSVSVFTGTSH